MRDVIVIGGGPTGSHVAYKLAGAGYRVAVLEQKQELGGQVCCTGLISLECADSFAIDNNVILRHVSSVRLFSPSGESITHLRWQKAQACIIDRPAFDVALARKAQNKGAEYLLKSQVKDIEFRDDKVSLEADCNGDRLTLEARAVVLAAGFGSRLTERLGLGRISDFASGGQANVNTNGLDEIEVYVGRETAPGFFAWLVPTLPNQALVGLLSRNDPRFYLKRLMSSLLAQGKIISINSNPRYRAIPLKPLPRTYGKRLLVVGDAAGQVKPTNGGGIYYGLLCADIAAETLHSALEKDDLSAKILASYQRKWKRKLGQELRIGYWARKFYERLNDQQITRIFDIIKSKGIDKFLVEAEDLSFDWHSEAILRLLWYREISKAMGIMKIPIQSRGGG